MFLRELRAVKRELRGIAATKFEEIWILMGKFEKKFSRYLPNSLELKGVQ